MAEPGTLPDPPPSTVPGQPAAASLATSELPGKAVDLVDHLVDLVGDKAVRPLVLAARGLVFGLLVATFGLLVLILAALMAVRLLDVYAFGGRVWAAETLVGGMLTLAGLWCWSKRSPGGVRAGPD